MDQVLSYILKKATKRPKAIVKTTVSKMNVQPELRFTNIDRIVLKESSYFSPSTMLSLYVSSRSRSSFVAQSIELALTETNGSFSDFFKSVT